MKVSRIKELLVEHSRKMKPITRYAVTLLLSTGIMVVSGIIAHQLVLSRADDQFKKDSEILKETLDVSFKRYNDLLVSLHSFVVSNNVLGNSVTKNQFEKYTDSLNLSTQYPAIHMLDIVKYIKSDQLVDFYQTIEEEYKSDSSLKNIRLININSGDNKNNNKNNSLNLQDRVLKSIAANKADSYTNVSDNNENHEHYMIQYANPLGKAYSYIGLDIANSFYTNEELSESKKSKGITTTGKLFNSKYNNEYPFIMLRQAVYKDIENKNFYGSVGASIRFDHTLFGDLNKNLSYMEFQVYSAQEDGKGLVYDSRFHRTSTDIPWPKSLFNEKIHKLMYEENFKIGNKDFIIRTFSPTLPPNVADMSAVWLSMFISFGITFGAIYFGIFKRIEREDVSNKTEAKVSHLKRQAHTDELTELFNRRAFFADLEEKMVFHTQKNSKMYLFFIDLDGFKRVNDTLGHSAGDVVLKEYANRLKNLSETNPCQCYRIGGDEFTVFIESKENETLSTVEVENFAHKLLDLTNTSFVVKEERFMLTQSIGIAEYPENGLSSESLFKNSDMAMYEAKRQGRNCYVFFSKKFSEEAEKRNRIINHLSSAVERNEFYLEFQPKMKKEDNKYYIKGVEALIRWNSSKLGNLSPGVFIPLAEEAGLMPVIGNWLVKEVARTMQKWKNDELGELKVAINLSAKQFNNDNLPDYYASILKQYEIDPTKVIIEITESAMMNEPAKTKELLNKFRSYGFGVSVDDFGTGHSSLSYLRQFPVTEIKIDKSFTDDILHDEHDSIIVEGIISMSQKLKLDVVVEGVESVEQVQWIEKQDLQTKVDHTKGIKIQGYYFSKPLGEEKLSQFIKMHKE